MEVRKLSDIQSRIMVIKMLKEHSENDKELSENYLSMKKSHRIQSHAEMNTI